MVVIAISVESLATSPGNVDQEEEAGVTEGVEATEEVLISQSLA